MRTTGRAIALVAGQLMAGASWAATIHVPADYSTIQAAVTAASPSDTIQVAAGTYAGPITIPCNKLGIVLSGAGRNNTFIELSSGGTGTPALSIGVTNCGAQTGGTIVEGFCFRNTGTAARAIGIRSSGTAANHGIIRNNRFENFADGGIATADYQFEYWDIHDNEFDGARLAIWVNDARHVTITHNQFVDFVVAVGSDFCDASFDVTVTDNTMDCGTYIPAPSNYYAIYLGGGAHDWTISGNTLSNFTWGIHVGSCGTGNNLTNVSIQNNCIAGPTRNGTQASTPYGINNLSSVLLTAENNWWGNSSGPYHAITNPSGTGVAVTDNVDFSPWLNFCPSSGPPATLALSFDKSCYKPGETVLATLSMADLPTPAAGFQAFMSYNASVLTFTGWSYTATPFGLPVINTLNGCDPADSCVNPSAGVLNLAAGINQFTGQTPSSANAVLATMTFTVIGSDNCTAAGLLTFRPHDPPTRLTDLNGIEILPMNALNAPAITIDGTNPTVIAGSISSCYPTQAAAEAAAIAATTATDNCTNPTPKVALTTGDPCAATIKVTATDCAGNSAFVTYNTRIDDTPPIITCPADTTVECSDSIDPSNTGTATATDHCDPSPVITYTDATSFVVTPASMDGWVFRTTDNTGTPPPTVNAVGEMVNGPATPPLGTGSAHLATGNGTLGGDESAQIRNTGYGGKLLSDLAALGYSTYATSWNGQQLPYLSLMVDYDGDGNVDDQLFFEPGYQNPGAGNPSLPDQWAGPNGPPQLNKWQTWDALHGGWWSNVLMGAASPGVFVDVSQQGVQPLSVIIAAAELAYPGQHPKILNPSGIGGVRINVGFTSPEDKFDCYADNVTIGTSAGTTTYDFELAACGDHVITRTWKATDSCGKTSTCPQTITVHDTTPPTIVCPQPVAVSCPADVPAPAVDRVAFIGQGGTVTDSCDGVPRVEFVSDVISAQTCADRYTITRTYKATDSCNNSDTCTQIITVNDQTPPTATCPGPVIVECPADVPAAATNLAGFLSQGGTTSDHCGSPVTVQFIGDVISDQTCPNRYTITRTYRITDDCGNFIDCTQIITVNDTTEPSITCPGDITIECTESLDPTHTGIASATDHCDGALAYPAIGLVGLSYSDVITPGSCPANKTIARTWRAQDSCGNFSTCVQTITVHDTTAPVITCPPNVTVDADAGLCTAVVATGTATALDDCDGSPVITFVREDGQTSLSDPFDSHFAGSLGTGVTKITWTATDACSNHDSCVQVITVNALNQMLVTVELSPTINTGGSYPQTLKRCITFQLWDCDHLINPVQTVNKQMTFTIPAANAPAIASEVVEVPCGTYTCVTARDKLHTLRRTLNPIGTSGPQYLADFVAAGKPLIGGNLNDDAYIDILDFGLYAGSYNKHYDGLGHVGNVNFLPDSGNTDCSTPFPHADISGNGSVFTEDFTFIQINFLLVRDANCCGAANRGAAEAPPITSITIAQLRAMGLNDSVVADLNGDGQVDQKDIAAWIQGARPGQPLPAPAPKRTR